MSNLFENSQFSFHLGTSDGNEALVDRLGDCGECNSLTFQASGLDSNGSQPSRGSAVSVSRKSAFKSQPAEQNISEAVDRRYFKANDSIENNEKEDVKLKHTSLTRSDQENGFRPRRALFLDMEPAISGLEMLLNGLKRSVSLYRFNSSFLLFPKSLVRESKPSPATTPPIPSWVDPITSERVWISADGISTNSIVAGLNLASPNFCSSSSSSLHQTPNGVASGLASPVVTPETGSRNPSINLHLPGKRMFCASSGAKMPLGATSGLCGLRPAPVTARVPRIARALAARVTHRQALETECFSRRE
ncbi:unnamed protein product [Protopolystoma xenopodis]|uniref:Uncharacterized protein n=1 Tax=Protopolystoma xenopodis TaxID=117903 RepID=A0A3S5AA49_9PLAT|nr:unnamed protein product [Protopolystoma xenopodis]